MKYIKLDCVTLGKKPGDIMEIGKGDNKISEADAKTLVSERMAEEYIGPVAGGTAARVKELEGQLADANTRNTELEAQLALLTPGKE